jgi:hypothetical protein
VHHFEALDGYAQACEPEVLTADLGPVTVELARILPALRERLKIEPRPPGDPEEDRWRLLRATTQVLHSVAARQPLLIVLEDLHDADRGTLDLLLHIARSVQGARILVMGPTATSRSIACIRCRRHWPSYTASVSSSASIGSCLKWPTLVSDCSDNERRASTV